MSIEQAKQAEQAPKDQQPQAEPEDDFLSGVKACDLSGEGACESCQ